MALQRAAATIFLLVFGAASGTVEIPDNLKSGRMQNYTACAKLFNQSEFSYAVDSKQIGNFKRTCNCSFYRLPANPSRSEINIQCHVSREIVIPISSAEYTQLDHILYYLVQYRRRGTADEWQQQRVDISDRNEARLDLYVGDISDPRVYEVKIYVVLAGGTRQLIQTEEIDSRTGELTTGIGDAVGVTSNFPPEITEGGTEFSQYSQTFTIDFNQITDTSMEVQFTSHGQDSFRLEYLRGGRRISLPLDMNGRATLRNLQPATEYIFITSYYRGGKWVEMRRKPVRTLAASPFSGGTYGGSVYQPIYGRHDVTLECPRLESDTVLTLSWYKGADRVTARLLATYNAETDTTTYPSDRDSRITVTGDGRILRIREPTAEYSGVYKCKYSILGVGDSWQSATQAYATVYITWRTRHGVRSYLIQYRPFESNAEWGKLILPHRRTPGTVIRNLQPLTKYEFKVYDYSNGLKGDLLDSLTKTTPFSSTQPVVPEPEDVLRAEELDHCTSYPCVNGNCRSTATGYQCLCRQGFTGFNCDQELDHCTSYPCLNGNCRSTATGYQCLCHQGFTGFNCDQELDHCTSYPCVNGNCRSTATGYQCLCHRGFIGFNCDQVVDYCAPRNPCENGGSCVSRHRGYYCRCRVGFSGTNCAEELNHCDPNPCQNSGICLITSSSSYMCRCRRGFTGRICGTAVPLNLCETRPCMHGTCLSLARSYKCRCDLGYEGRDCDVHDDSAYLVLHCPIEPELYGPPELIRWYKYDGGIPKLIYEYDAVNHEGIQMDDQYRGRLSSPYSNKLRIVNHVQSDLGIYECSVSYEEARSSSLPMNLVSVSDERAIGMQWPQSQLETDHYTIQYRDASHDGSYIEENLPGTSNTYEIHNVRPGDIYDIVLSESVRGSTEKVAVYFVVLDTIRKPSRSDRIPDHQTGSSDDKEPEQEEREPDQESEIIPLEQYNDINVRVYGPITPVATGAVAHLECAYPPDPKTKPTITWKKISGNRSIFLYNQKMPPTPSASRVNMINERTLRIRNFQPADGGTYECNVNFRDEKTYKVGSGQAKVEALEAAELSAPTNFRYGVVDHSTTDIWWQQPHATTVTGYIIRFWPTDREFGQYLKRETTSRQLTLNDLTEGSEYNVEIQATDGIDYSQPLVGRFDQLIEDVPTPENLQVTMMSTTEARITWDQPNPQGVTGYSVQYWDVRLPSEGNLVELTTTNASADLSDLDDGREYQVRIRAMKGEHPSRHLVSQFIKVTPVIPNPPKNVRFKNIGGDSVTVYWAPPSGWKPADKYRVLVDSADKAVPFAKVFPDAAPNMLAVKQLRPGVLYRFKVYTIRSNLSSLPATKHVRTVQNIVIAAPYPAKLTLECKAHVFGEPFRTTWYKISSSGVKEPIFTSTATTTRREFTPNREAIQYTGRLSSQSLEQLEIDDIQYPDDFGKYICTMLTHSGNASDLFDVIAKYPQSIEAPTRLSSLITGDTTARIMWRHPYHEDITSYVVRFWPTIRRFGNEMTFETEEPWTDLTGLVEGTEYQVEIKAKINDRVSDDSLIGQFINFANTVTNVKIVRLGDGVELKLSWENPPGLDGVQLSVRRESNLRWNDQPPMSPDTTSRKVRIPMREGETISFKITSLKNNIPSPVVVHYTEHNLVDLEETGPAPEVTKPENTPLSGARLPYPTPPSNLVLQSVNPSVLRARWEPTPDVQFDTYNVNVTNLGTREYEQFYVRKSYIQINHLVPHGTYEVAVSTVRNGISSFPIMHRLTLGDETEPEEEQLPTAKHERLPAPRESNEREVSSAVRTPTNIRFSYVMRSRFTVSWDTPEEDITDFGVEYRPSGKNAEWIREDVIGSTSTTLRGLATDTMYEVRVSSHYVTGEKSFPLIGTQRTRGTAERRLILRQPNARVIGKTNNSFTIEWVPQEADHRVIVTPLGGAGRRQIINAEKGRNRIVVTDLDAGKRHRTTVTALSDGRRSKSAVLHTTTNPNKPENVRAAAIDSTRVAVKWTEPLSTLTTGYRVSYTSVLNNSMEVIETSSNRVDLTDLQPGTTYVVQVQTKQGNEISASESITVKTMEEPVDAPREVRVADADDSIHVTWSPAADAEYYEVSSQMEDEEDHEVMSLVMAPTTSLEIADMLPGHYIISITAGNGNTKSAPRNVTFTMPVRMPKNLHISDVRSDGFRAQWQAPLTRLYSPQYDVIALENSIQAPLLLPSEKRTDLTSFNFERLRPNTDYRVEVVSRYGRMKSGPVTAVVTTGVDAPNNLQFTDVGEDSLVVEWSPPRSRQRFQYEIHVTKANRPARLVHKETTEENWHLIQDLAPGTEYMVGVTAVSGDQRSESITGKVTTVVPSPTGLEAPMTIGNEAVEVSWDKVPYADAYTVIYHPTSGGNPTTLNIPGGRNSVTINDLNPETRYIVKVIALIGNQESEPNQITFMTGQISVSQPDELEAVVYHRKARITWAPVENVDEYEVTYSPVGEDSNVVTKVVTSPYYDITNVEPGDYEITVTAIKSGYRSPTAVLEETLGVTAPEDLQFEDITEDAFIAIWNPPSTRDITGYEIHSYNTTDQTQHPIIKETTENYIKFVDLTPGTDYVVDVRAKKSDQISEPLIGTVSTDVPSPQVIQGNVLPGVNDDVEVFWEGISNVDYYEVNYRPVGGTTQVVVIDGNESSTVLSGLAPDTEYIVEVTSSINGKKSRPIQTRITTPLRAPENVLVQPVTSNDTKSSTITVTWEGQGTAPLYEIKYYTVVHDGDSLVYGQPQYRTASASDRGAILQGLLPATEYIVEIKSLDGSKASRPKSVPVLTTLDKPGVLELEEPGEDSITVNWQPPEGEVTGYVVKLVQSDGSDIITIPVSADKHSVRATGLKPDTEYEVRVVAQNRDKGIESSPLAQRAKTRPLNTKPTNVRLLPESDGSYTIMWDAPTYEVMYYTVTWSKTSGNPMKGSLQVFNATGARTMPLEPNTEYVIDIQSITDYTRPPTEYDSTSTRIRTGVPGLQTDLDIPDITDDSVVVQWSVPAQERFLTGFRVELFQEDEIQPIRSVDVPRSRNAVSLRELEPSTTYRITVTPHIENSPGQSASEYVTTDALREPPVPDHVNIPEVTTEDIVVQWYYPANHEHITRYNVVVQDEDGNIVTEQNVPGDSQTATISGLKPGTTYYVYVRSAISDRMSEPVPEVATTLPREPAGVTPRNVLSNQFEVYWSPSPVGEVTSYLVTVIPVHNPELPELFYQTEDPSILIPDVEPDTTYRVEVIAVGEGDLESTPTVVRITTNDVPPETTEQPLPRPEQAVTILPGLAEMVIKWKELTDAPVTTYQILYLRQGDDEPKIVTVPSDVGEFVLSALEPTTQYDIWVRAILENGDIVPVPIHGHETVTHIAPENYVPLTEEPVTAPADGKMSIIWEDLGPDVTQYGLTYSWPNFANRQQVVVPGDYTSILLSGLAPGEDYVISLIGMRDGIDPVLVNSVHVGISDIVPDDTVVSGSTANGQITLQWVSDIEEDEDNKVIGYKIIFDRKCCLGEPEMAWIPGKDSETATIGMLEPDTEYVFRIEAATGDGQSIPVPTVEIADEMVLPESQLTENLHPPTNISKIAQGFTSTIHWYPPEGGRRPLTHYTITYTPVDNEFAPTLRATVPKTETSHTMTGLSPDTQYSIDVQSANLPMRTISHPETITYQTPIGDADQQIEVDVEVNDKTTQSKTVTTTMTPTVTALTPHAVVPTPTTTSYPEPLRSASRPSSLTPSNKPDEGTVIFTPQDGHVTISWEPFYTDIEPGWNRITYFPQHQPDDVREVILPSYLESVTVTMLQPATPYEAHVEAITDTNEEIPRRVMVVKEEPPRVLHPYKWIFKPEITDIERQSGDSAIIHWVNPHRQPRKVTHYNLELRPKFNTNESAFTRVEIPANRTMHVFSGLVPDKHYIVGLQAVSEPTNTRSSTVMAEFTNSAPEVPVPPVHTLAAVKSPATPLPVRPDETAPNTDGLLTEDLPENTFTDTEPGIGALQTFDGNIIVNWTPAQTSVDNYILQWQTVNDGTPAKNITVPGDRSWANIPEVPQGEAYIVNVFTSSYGKEPQQIYTISLNHTSGNVGGSNLAYRPIVRVVNEDGIRASIQPGSDNTHQVYIPIENPQDTLPDDKYLLQQPDSNVESIITTTDQEYVNWLQPVRRRIGNANSVTLRWNPEYKETARQSKYRVTLVPINHPNVETLVKYVPANAAYNIQGLQPGVSYHLNATYIQNDGMHHAGEVAADFVIPAFSRFGVPITERRYGISEVWMKELRSGELLLQWEEFPGATEYRIEHSETPDGQLYQDAVHPDQRWIVLPRLTPGHMYTLNIYATVRGISTKIYTVTVRRKVTGPAPPSKIEWYNMFGRSVDLSWTPPKGYITGYKLTYRAVTGDDKSDREIYLTANTTKYHLDNLTPGETYTIVLQSLQDHKLSRHLSFPLRMTIPTVRRIFFQQTTPKQIVVRWPKLPDYVTGYLVQVTTMSPSGNDLISPTTLPPDQTNFTINGVKPGVKYEFTIRTLIEQAVSEPITLHLWTLKAQSELTRAEQTGTWSLTWTGNPYEVDHWRIEVKMAGSNRPLLLDDNIDRFQTRYELRGLTPGVEYIVYIYGVKNDLLSTPIQIRVPAHPYSTTSQRKQVTHRQHTSAIGTQLLRKFIVRRTPTQIELDLIPIDTVDRYVVKYKKSTESFYRTTGVRILYDDPTTTAIIQHLDPGSSYNIAVLAIKGEESSDMNFNVETPVRNVITQSLRPLQSIRRDEDTNPDGTGFYIRWRKPRIPVSHYTITYNYTGMDEVVVRTVAEPSVYVPNLGDGQRATFVISYTTNDGQMGPKSILSMSTGIRSNGFPRVVRSNARRTGKRSTNLYIPGDGLYLK